jgi:hypothetical protein
MNMPAFSAEASLAKTSMHYRIGTQRVRAIDGSVVYPAARVCGACECDTYDYGQPGTCAKLCINGPYQEPYPVLCAPSECNPPCGGCGPCTQTCQTANGPVTKNCN